MGMKLLNYVKASGLAMPDAYLKVNRVTLETDQRCAIQVCIWPSEQDRLDGKAPETIKEYHIYRASDKDAVIDQETQEETEPAVTCFQDHFSVLALDALDNNIITSSYEYLKAFVSEYAGATDA